jgi:hypothetical protein
MKKVEINFVPEFLVTGIALEGKYLSENEMPFSGNLYDFVKLFCSKVTCFYVLGEKFKKALYNEAYHSDIVGYMLKHCIEIESNCIVRYYSASLNRFLDTPPTFDMYPKDNSFIAKFRRKFELKLVDDLNPDFWKRLEDDVNDYHRSLLR